MTLGEKIQQLRKENNLSQEQLAEKVNISRQAISKWELDITAPDIQSIILLCKIFNVTSDELIGNNQSSTQSESPKNQQSDYDQQNGYNQYPRESTFEQVIKYAKKRRHFVGYYFIVYGLFGLVLATIFGVIGNLMMDTFEKTSDSMIETFNENAHGLVSASTIDVGPMASFPTIVAFVMGGLALISIIVGIIITVHFKKLNRIES